MAVPLVPIDLAPIAGALSEVAAEVAAAAAAVAVVDGVVASPVGMAEAVAQVQMRPSVGASRGRRRPAVRARGGPYGIRCRCPRPGRPRARSAAAPRACGAAPSRTRRLSTAARSHWEARTAQCSSERKTASYLARERSAAQGPAGRSAGAASRRSSSLYHPSSARKLRRRRMPSFLSWARRWARRRR